MRFRFSGSTQARADRGRFVGMVGAGSDLNTGLLGQHDTDRFDSPAVTVRVESDVRGWIDRLTDSECREGRDHAANRSASTFWIFHPAPAGYLR